MKKVLIVGATSSIAQATARLYATESAQFFLIARNANRLQAVAEDLRERGASKVDTAVMDANDFDAHHAIITRAMESLGGIDLALIAHGTLSNQEACEESAELLREEFNTNCISTICLMTHLANLLQSQGSGTLAVISSVAGDRGRKSNYVYGAAKGAVGLFAQGLRNRLHDSGVHVLTIKPGFVDTPMTAEFPKGPLWAKPERVAQGIKRAEEKRRDIVHLPGFWRMIMFVIRSIPERIFKRLSL